MRFKHDEDRADTVIGSITLILLCVLAAFGCIVFFGDREYFTAFVCFVLTYSLLRLLKHLHE